jgi:hypothetical protein
MATKHPPPYVYCEWSASRDNNWPIYEIHIFRRDGSLSSVEIFKTTLDECACGVATEHALGWQATVELYGVPGARPKDHKPWLRHRMRFICRIHGRAQIPVE